MQTNKLTVKDISTLSYTSFVGLINQWNVPPGAFVTLKKWEIFSQLSTTSKLLDVACTTGFSSRELARISGCHATGIDISADSVAAAERNAMTYAPGSQLAYQVIDALEFTSDQPFSHILVGAALRFFPEPVAALNHLLSLLAPDGYFLSCEFYTTQPLPPALVERAHEVFDIDVTQAPYKEVMSIYKNLTLVYEDRNTPLQETETELQYYCQSTIAAFAATHPEVAPDVLRAMYERLYRIKVMSNDLRPYQAYNVLIHKRDSRFYPYRYTELF